MKLIKMKCPGCNANLDYEEGMSQMFCKYCGTKILLDTEEKNSNHNFNFKFMSDREAVQKAKTEHLIKKEEYKLAHKEEKQKRFEGIMFVICMLIFSILYYLISGQIY